MTKLILIVVLFFSSNLHAQNKDTIGLNMPFKDGKLMYEGVIEQPGKSKIDLYNNAKQWFVDYFKSSKDIIQSEDKEQGRIVGKGVILVYANPKFEPYKVDVTVQVDSKENKYRYRFYNFSFTQKIISLDGSNPEYNSFTPEELVGVLNGYMKIKMMNKKYAKIDLENLNKEVMI